MGSATIFLPWQKTTTTNQASSTTGTAYNQSREYIAAPSAPSSVLCRYALSDATAETATETVAVKPFVIRLTKNAVSLPIVPGSIAFTFVRS